MVESNGLNEALSTPKNGRKHLADWLRNAYAMEHQAIEMLEKEATRIEHYPELKKKIIEHLGITKNQANRIEQALASLGEDTSMLKTGLAKLIGTAQALSGLVMSDEIVKVAIALYIFGHYKIGNFIVLIETAKNVGAGNVANTCQEILKEEEAMVEWMKNYLPQMTRQYLQKDSIGDKAKR